MQISKNIMNRITLTLTFLLTTFLCFGQNEHLEPARNFNQYDSDLKEYYDNVFPLLYRGFSEKPYARYASMPSFSANYAFSVEKNDEKYYIITNTLSENFWYAGYDKKGNMDNKRRKSVKLNTIKTEINNELYLKIGELFELLANQTKVPEKKQFGCDGTTYYFSTTDKNGEIKIGTTWSPEEKSLLGRLIKICNDLYFAGREKNINQKKITEEITVLINDFKKNN